jgi:hypothetical protein
MKHIPLLKLLLSKTLRQPLSNQWNAGRPSGATHEINLCGLELRTRERFVERV